MKLHRVTTILLGLAVFAACSDHPTGFEPPAESRGAYVAQTIDDRRADILARAFALGMTSPDVRAGVRDAMRASLVTEHKLVLQDFVQTTPGKALLTAGAGRLHVSVDSLEKIIAQLPALDFYVPSRAQRRSWRGNSSIGVAGTASQDRSTLNVHDVNGHSTLGPSSRLGNFGASFLLQLAETKSKRVDPQVSVAGSVIEEATDGTLSGSLVEYLPDGSKKVTELADYFAEVKRLGTANLADKNIARSQRSSFEPPISKTMPVCEVDCGGGGGSSEPADTTYLGGTLVVISVCDNGNCWEGNEFEWHTYYSADNGATWTNRMDIRIEGVNANEERNLWVPALLKVIRPFSSDKITSDVVETDGWNPSDSFTPSRTWTTDENGKLKAHGDDRCGYPKYYGGYYDCYDPYLNFPWKELNFNFSW